ncbi:MAG: ABC transporter permease [Clostridia bacterium]|nr:ABC transporter permease [Clostridia bacterium]
MSLNLLILDIKRLLGHGKAGVLALVAPLAALLVFAAIIVPLLAGSGSLAAPYAICNEDQSEPVELFINLLANSESLRDISTAYPVDDIMAGFDLLEQGKVSVVVHIGEDFYQRLLKGENAQVSLYAYPSHAFEQTMISLTLNHALAAVGQSQNLLEMTGQAAVAAGVAPAESARLVADGLDQAIRRHMERRSVLSRQGALSPTGDYLPVEYYLAALFSLGAALAMLPSLHLTAFDLQGPLCRRGALAGRRGRRFLIARLVSGGLLINLTLLLLLPAAVFIHELGVYWGRGVGLGWLALLLALPLISLTLSALGLCLGSLAKQPRLSLWYGFYAVLLMAVLSGALLSEGMLPPLISELGRWTPLKPSMSIIANTLFAFDPARYLRDISRLLLLLFVYCLAGGFLYSRKGAGR